MAARLILTLIVTVVLVQDACALKCWICTSYKSNEDCKSREEVQSCTSGQNRCLSMHYQWGATTSYRKGCVSEKSCSTQASCPLSFSSCTVNCCSSDKCNGGGKAKSSILLLALACSAIGFIITWH